MTLVEAMIAVLILAMVTLGSLGSLLTARQMADFARKRMIVDAAVQGVMEQLKNRDAQSLLPGAGEPGSQPTWFESMDAMKSYINDKSAIPSLAVTLANDTATPLSTLVLSPNSKFIDPRNIPAGTIPAMINKDGFGDLDGDGQPDVGVNTLTLHMRNPGAVKKQSDDINVYIMVWVKDASLVGGSNTIIARSISINYTWTYKEGRVTHKTTDSIRAVRSNPS